MHSPVRTHRFRSLAAPFAVAVAALATNAAAQDPAAGAPLREPPVRTQVDGTLTTQLRLHVDSLLLDGQPVRLGLYEGTLPGPTLRVRPGGRMVVTLVNDLALPDSALSPRHPVECASTVHGGAGHMPPSVPPMPMPAAQLWTNLHTHGLQVSPAANGDNPFVTLKAGESCTYDIPVPDNQPPGLHWYHPHRHGSTSKQGWSGLAGAIIVEGGLDTVAALRGVRDRVIVLQEIWTDERGRVPQAMPIPVAGPVPFSTIPVTRSSFTYTVNGQVRPEIDIRPGEVQRWRLLNASPHRFFLLTLAGHGFYQIAQDGIAFARPRPAQQILLAPGNRVEVLVKGGAAGRYALTAAAYDQGHPGGALPEVALGTVVADGARGEGSIPERLVEPDPIPVAITRTRRVVFSGDIRPAPVKFFLDSVAFDPDSNAQSIPGGTAEEWTLVNQDVFQHPFHIHVNPFQVVEVNGVPVQDPVWWDTFALPARGTVKVRMFFRDDMLGRTVYHCHILPHEDNGMMAAIELLPPPGAAGTGGRQ